MKTSSLFKASCLSAAPALKRRGRPFAKGPDPRRKIFTREEHSAAGRAGWRATMERHPHLGFWLYLQIKRPKKRPREKGDCS